MNMRNSSDRRHLRREEAAKRAADREKRGDAGQLQRLETKGHAHCKEAKRLHKRLTSR